MMQLQIAIETATQSKLIQLQQHIWNEHKIDVAVDKLASDVLKSALDVYPPKAYCVRCNGVRKVQN